MKQTTSIIGINFIVLIISILWLKAINNIENEIIYFIPVIALTALNIVLCLAYFFKGKKGLAKTFMLAGLIVLIVGSSSCVSIKPRKKRKKKKPEPVVAPVVINTKSDQKNYWFYNELYAV